MVVISLDKYRDMAIFGEFEVISKKGCAIHALLGLLKQNGVAK